MRNFTGTKKLRSLTVALSLLICPVAWVQAEPHVSVSIGINVPVYPRLVLVPGYPVYYAPQMRMNYFFYDGLYWVYQNDGWYVSSWYNGPWDWVEPEEVPLFILRIPVRYYRYPPHYFRSWYADAPPRWGEYWGRDWENRHRDWNRWDRRAIPRPAPLPIYQQRYSGDRYPHITQQYRIQSDQYRYRPRDEVTRQHFRRQDEGRERAAPQRNESFNPQRRMPAQEQPQLRLQPTPQLQPVQPRQLEQRQMEQHDRRRENMERRESMERREHIDRPQERREITPRAQPIQPLPPVTEQPGRDRAERRGNAPEQQDRGGWRRNEEGDQGQGRR